MKVALAVVEGTQLGFETTPAAPTVLVERVIFRL